MFVMKCTAMLLGIVLAGSCLPVKAQPSLTPPLPAPSVACTPPPELADLAELPDLEAEAAGIDPEELAKTAGGIYKLGDLLVPADANVSPDGFTMISPAHIGKQADGKYHISYLGRPPCLDDLQKKAYQRDTFGAMLAASADSGRGGVAMKTAFDEAPDKLRFARVLGRAFQRSNEKQSADSDAAIALLRSLPIGETRSAVYKTLKSRSIVVYNFMFSPGRSFLHGRGCNPEATKKLAEYPVYGERLPKYNCPDLASYYKVAPLSPNASAEFFYGFDLACGSRRMATLDFDVNDRLKNLYVSDLRESCL